MYLDVGSNVGVQVRKLYEPELFTRPVPPVAAWYDKLFGNATRLETQKNSKMVVFFLNPLLLPAVT